MTMATRTQTMVQLTDDLVTLLDERAAAAGVSRSHLIREAIETFLATDRKAAIDRAIVDGYTRMPQADEHDDWGDLAVQVSTLTSAQMRRLNEEEHAAGFDPW